MRVRPRTAAVIALAACAGVGVVAWIALPQADGPGSTRSDPYRVGPSKAPPPLVVGDPRAHGATLPAAARANASKKDVDSDPAARVAPFRELPGRVTRQDTGEAVAGALVTSQEGPVAVAEPAEFRLTAEGTSVVEAHGGVFTDAQGRFRVPTGHATRVRLRVVHPSFLTAFSDAIDVSESGDDAEVAIRMQAGGSLECEFVGLEAALPILGRLFVGGEGVERRAVELKGPREFTLAGIPIGRVEVEIEDLHTEPNDEGGLVPPFRSYVHVSAEAPRPLSFPVRRGIAVDVRVTRGGAPVRTADVSIWGYGGPFIRPVGSEKEGVYSFRGVPQERVEVHVRTESLANRVSLVDLTEGKRAQVSVEVPSSGIRGRVRVVGRTLPPSGLWVWLYPLGDAARERELGSTDESGFYAFGDVRPGRYRLTVAEPFLANGRTDEPQLASVLPAERQVEVPEGGVASVDFDLQPAGALTVHVVTADGTGVPDAVITLMPAASTSSRDRRWSGFFRRGGLTGENGAVRLRGITNGRYIAHLDQSEYGDLHSDPVDVVAGTENEVTIRVTSHVCIRLLLEVETRQGHKAFGWYGRLRDAAGNRVETPIPHNSGANAMALVEPGEYRLSIEGDDYKPVERLLHVTAPSPHVVRIVLDEKE